MEEAIRQVLKNLLEIKLSLFASSCLRWAQVRLNLIHFILCPFHAKFIDLYVFALRVLRLNSYVLLICIPYFFRSAMTLFSLYPRVLGSVLTYSNKIGQR